VTRLAPLRAQAGPQQTCNQPPPQKGMPKEGSNHPEVTFKSLKRGCWDDCRGHRFPQVFVVPQRRIPKGGSESVPPELRFHELMAAWKRLSGRPRNLAPPATRRAPGQASAPARRPWPSTWRSAGPIRRVGVSRKSPPRTAKEGQRVLRSPPAYIGTFVRLCPA